MRMIKQEIINSGYPGRRRQQRMTWLDGISGHELEQTQGSLFMGLQKLGMT